MDMYNVDKNNIFYGFRYSIMKYSLIKRALQHVQTWTKKRTTRCYSYACHRREMKLVPFFMVKCPL